MNEIRYFLIDLPVTLLQCAAVFGVFTLVVDILVSEQPEV